MRLRERFQRMMYGRYGSDQLSMFCFVLYLVIWVVGLFILRATGKDWFKFIFLCNYFCIFFPLFLEKYL